MAIRRETVAKIAPTVAIRPFMQSLPSKTNFNYFGRDGKVAFMLDSRVCTKFSSIPMSNPSNPSLPMHLAVGGHFTNEP